MEKTAQEGDEVTVHYIGKLEDGTVFDNSRAEEEPLTFKLGMKEVIPGVEEAIAGMKPGESITAEIPTEKGYGEQRDDMIIPMERDRIPDDVDPEIGQQLQLRLENGQTLPVIVTEIKEDEVVIDANHPLAGRDLVFEIELLSIQ